MKKNVVILGGGFGGLRAALSIADKLATNQLLEKYQVVLIDRHEYHTYTPLLYKLAIPPLQPSQAINQDLVTPRFQEILKGKNIAFIQGETIELDLKAGDIHLGHGEEIRCDYLVLAPGSETNYFDIPGLQENALPLKYVSHAKKINTAISELISQNPATRFVIGGGGPTGVEMAGEIKYNYPAANVSIIEASPTLLPGFNSGILRAAKKRLLKLGVEIIVGEPIVKVEKRKAISKSGYEVAFDLMIWTGGVKAPAFLAKLPLKVEPRGRVEVAPEMLCLPQTPDLKLGPMIYALGDSVCVYDPITGKPLPGVAPTAIEQGQTVAKNIIEDIQTAESIRTKQNRTIYHPKEHPYVMPIGGRWAVAKIGPFILTGLLAYLFKMAIEIDYRLSIR